MLEKYILYMSLNDEGQSCISKTQIVLEPLGGLDTFLEVWITLASNFSKTRKSFVYSKAFVRDHTDLKGFVSDT
jgi:hypothetical protein